MHPFLQQYFGLIKRFMPVERQKSVIGLDIGQALCRAVEISPKDGSFLLRRMLVVPLEGSDEKSAVTKIVSVFNLKENPRPLIVSIGGKGTLIRHVDLPRMSAKDLKRAFAIEADQYFPFPKDSIYTDCHILDPKASSKKMAVLVAAIKRDVVDAKLKMLKEAGADAHVLTLNAVALANAFAAFPPSMVAQQASGKDMKAVALIDIREQGTTLMIMVEGLPRFSRDIFVGVSEIVKRVANSLGVSETDARGLLNAPGDKQEAVVKSVEAVAASLVSEMRISFDYFVTEKSLQIGQLYLTGEGAAVAGLEATCAQSLDMPLVHWNPFEKLVLDVSVRKEEAEKEGRRFTTALGLALNEYD